MHFVADLPLSSIFNVFDRQGDTDAAGYRLKTIEENEPWTYPDHQNHIAAPAASYEKVAAAVTDIFTQWSPQAMTLSELLQVLEKTLSYVPSSTNTAEAADISLYGHQKLTAAFAVCLWHVFQERGITDYKSYCYGKRQKDLRSAPVYRLASGDISGIQKFIYTIPSKGALKSLRGRSLYLDILLEHIVDEILEACHVSRSCLLYTGVVIFIYCCPIRLIRRLFCKKQIALSMIGFCSTMEQNYILPWLLNLVLPMIFLFAAVAPGRFSRRSVRHWGRRNFAVMTGSSSPRYSMHRVGITRIPMAAGNVQFVTLRRRQRTCSLMARIPATGLKKLALRVMPCSD